MASDTGMTPRIYANVWQWCELIASSYGPKGHTTRLVLLVMALNMSRNQNVAWPSQKKLAQRTGLGLRTVKRAVSVADQDGWLQLAGIVDTDSGMGWRGNEYTATVPAQLAEHIPNFDLVVNRPVEGGAPQAPPRHETREMVVPIGHQGGANDGTRVVPGRPPESPNESPSESSEGAPRKGGAPQAPPSGARAKSPDDLKNRVAEKSKATEAAEALRQIASAAMARPVGGSKRKVQPVTDSDLAVKVRKLRDAGHDDALIKRQLSSQASEPQLERVLQRSMEEVG